MDFAIPAIRDACTKLGTEHLVGSTIYVLAGRLRVVEAQSTGTSRIGRSTFAPGPSKCHHSPEYPVKPPVLIAERRRPRFACSSALTPSVANA